MDKLSEKSVLYRILYRISIFFFLMLLILLALYTIGNYQSFLDFSQLFILRTMSVFSICLLVLAIMLVFMGIFFSVYQKTVNYIRNILISVFNIIVSLVFLFFSSGIDFLSGGV